MWKFIHLKIKNCKMLKNFKGWIFEENQKKNTFKFLKLFYKIFLLYYLKIWFSNPWNKFIFPSKTFFNSFFYWSFKSPVSESDRIFSLKIYALIFGFNMNKKNETQTRINWVLCFGGKEMTFYFWYP